MKKGHFTKILAIFIVTLFSLLFSILLIEASLLSDPYLDANRVILDSPDVYEDEIESLFLNNLEDNSDIEYRHLSPKGNQTVATIVYEYLSKKNLLNE